MLLFGLSTTLLSAIFYSIRFALVKKLSHLPKLHLNLFYRLSSLPFLFVLILFIPQAIIFKPGFAQLFGIIFLFQLFYSYFQTTIYQDHQLSLVESLSFLEILFSTIFGIIFFHDHLSLPQIFVIIVFILSFCFLYLSENQRSRSLPPKIILYFFFTAIIGVFNKQLILLSTPLTLVITTTFSLVICYLIVLKFRHQALKITVGRSNQFSILIIGFLAVSSFMLMGFGYQYLPLGLVSVISSTKSLFSLYISRRTFGETNLIPKIAVSLVSILVLPLLFLTK